MNAYIILFILILMGAIYSALETALFSIERKKEQEALKKTNSGFFNNPFILLNTFLLGNIVSNTLFSQLGDVLIEQFLFSFSLSQYVISFVSVIISTIISVIFIESIPKNFGIAYPRLSYRLFSPIIRISTILFSVVVFPMTKFFDLLFRRASTKKETEKLTEKEIRSIINLSYEREIVNPREKKLIDAITNLYSQQVYFFMIPRKNVVSVDIDHTFEDAWSLMKKHKTQNILVIDRSIDNVVGFLSIPDVAFLEEKKRKEKLRDHFKHITSIKIISESKRLVDAIHLLGQQKRSLALVIDEYGGTQGIITLKGLTQILLSFKNIVALSQNKGSYNQSILEEGENYIIINPLRMNILFLREYFGIDADPEIDQDIDPEENLTRSLLKILDRFPVVGEEISYHNLIFKIDQVENNFVSRIKVIKKDEI